jgi:hypothetical protein
VENVVEGEEWGIHRKERNGGAVKMRAAAGWRRENPGNKKPRAGRPGAKESRVLKIWLLNHAMCPRPGRRLMIIMPIIMARTLAVGKFIEWR